MGVRRKQRGSQTLEFTLIGIPLTFLLFSIANMSFAMLTLHTLQQSVEQGARYVVTRGSTCSSGTNSCSATVQQIAAAVANTASGISTSSLNVSLIPASGSTNQITCNPVSTCLSSCSSGCNANRTTVWPTSGSSDNSPGKDIIITADWSGPTPMYMFWEGPGASARISTTSFHAYSRQRLMF